MLDPQAILHDDGHQDFHLLLSGFWEGSSVERKQYGVLSLPRKKRSVLIFIAIGAHNLHPTSYPTCYSYFFVITKG